MKRFNIVFKISGGDEVQANSTAHNQAEAVEKVMTTEQFIKFVGDREILSVDIKPAVPEPQVNQGRFVVQPSVQEGLAVLADTAYNVVIKFKIGDFNGSARVTSLDGAKVGPQRLSTILRQAAEWLKVNRLDLLTEDADAVKQWRLLRIGKQIRDARLEQGLTQKQLGEMSGVGYNHISQIEMGCYSATIDTLGKLCAALNISLDVR